MLMIYRFVNIEFSVEVDQDVAAVDGDFGFGENVIDALLPSDAEPDGSEHQNDDEDGYDAEYDVVFFSHNHSSLGGFGIELGHVPTFGFDAGAGIGAALSSGRTGLGAAFGINRSEIERILNQLGDGFGAEAGDTDVGRADVDLGERIALGFGQIGFGFQDIGDASIFLRQPSEVGAESGVEQLGAAVGADNLIHLNEIDLHGCVLPLCDVLSGLRRIA